MRIAITGSNGQLGKELRKALGRDTLILIDIHNYDITDRRKTFELLKTHKPEAIIHGAAMTDVDGCERDPEMAHKSNIIGTRNIVEAARELNAYLVHVSTDYVFDGQKDGAYVETDRTDPINVYGRTKLDAESEVLKAIPSSVIIRTAWLYGDGNNFVRKILNLAKSRPVINVVGDQRGSPTYAKDLAAAITDLIRMRQAGIFHFSNDGSCSRFEFAKEIVRLANLTTVVRPVNSDAFPVPVRRPMNSTLDCSKIKKIGVTVRDWKEALHDYMYDHAAVEDRSDPVQERPHLLVVQGSDGQTSDNLTGIETSLTKRS